MATHFLDCCRLPFIISLSVLPTLASAQSIADKRAEMEAAEDQKQAADPTPDSGRLDSLRFQATIDSISFRARRVEDSLHFAATVDSLRAVEREEALRIHILEDSLRDLRGLTQGEVSPIKSREDSLAWQLDSLKRAAASDRITDQAVNDSLRRELARSDSAQKSPREQPATRSEAQKVAPDPEHDPYFDDRDANFLNASVIKSIAGERPSTEFFDLRFRIQIHDRPGWVDTMVVDTVAAGSGGRPRTRMVRIGEAGAEGKRLTLRLRQPLTLFTISAIDVALSSVVDSVPGDSAAQRERKKLTEGTLGIYLGLPAVTRVTENKVVRFRRYFVGPLIKIFSTDPYYGVSAGSVELGGSSLRSSYLFTALLRRFYPDPALRLHNFYVEFFLRSSNIDFFEVLSLRGGVLFPLGKEAERQGVTSRIAIEVPVVSWPF
jgi:hypothetical protein